MKGDTVTYLAVDPGDTAGLALISASGELLWEAMPLHEELPHVLEFDVPFKNKLKAIIVEDFALLPHKGQAVSQKKSRHMKAARGIGVCEMYAHKQGLPLYFQNPAHWRIGLQLAGIAPKDWPKDHSKGHSTVAFGSGFHWLVGQGVVQARLPSL